MGTIKIYILHGWTYSLEKWEGFSRLLKKADIDPIFLKIPGLTEKSSEVWDLDKYTEWLNNKINSETIILGHSNGGRIAISFALKYPNKVKKLILIDSAGIYHNELFLQMKRFIFGEAAKIGKKITNAKVLRKFLYRLARENDYQDATPEMKKSMLNLINHDLTPKLSEVKVPTFIIWGENDKVTPVSDAFIFKKLIPHSKLEIIKHAKHSPFYTHPKEVVLLIKNAV